MVNHPQETGFVNKLDDVGVPINPQVVFPEGTVKLIDNDDQTIVSLTVKIRNSENGDLLFEFLRIIP